MKEIPNFTGVNAIPRFKIDGFVTKMSVDGSAIEYSTYLAGSSNDFGLGIAVDVAGQAWVTGFAQYVVDPDDPFPNGFTVGDIWGGEMD